MRLSLLLLAPALCACASSPIARVERGLLPDVRVEGDPLAWSIEERMRAHHTPAVSVAVIDGYKVVWARAWGVADVRTGRRADASTLFQAASISKLVTALAALRAVDAGRLTLDDDVNRALTGWKLPENDLTRASPVTLRHLLAHTAGLNVRTVNGHSPGAPLPTLRQVLDGEPPANTAPVRVEERPGARFRYSGGGSLIVQQLVVDVMGKPFPAAMNELVFAPLGLRASSFDVPMPAELRARAATPHDHDLSILPDRVYVESAPAGLWSTPSDLARLLAEIQLGLEGRSSVISRELARRMTTPVAPIGVPDVSTGLGTFVERHGDAIYFGHDGMNDGFLSVARATTVGGKGAVVMANGAGAAPLLLEILRGIAVAYDWPGWVKPPIRPARVAAARLRALAGRYRAGVDRSVDVVVRGDRLEAREPFGAPRALVPTSDDTFVDRLDGTRYVFRSGELVCAPPDDDPVTLARVAGDDAAVEPLRLLEAGREEEALARYRALVAAQPKDPALAEARFDALGSELLDRRGEVERAIRVFRVEAALYPGSPNANAGLALAYLRAGRRAEAAPFIARALALRAEGKRGTEVEEIWLGVRMERVQRLAAAAR
jgi:CubicO group peptidase (beta-lactamase class C family)